MSCLPEAVSEYKVALSELSFNSKPLINMLTMLADDYKDGHAQDIARCIEARLREVSADKKLPLLYLIDSICKNIEGKYVELFTQNIVSNFCHVFERSDERTRLSMFKLRKTWLGIFPSRKLYAIDVRIKGIDPAWPVTATEPDDKSTEDMIQNNANESKNPATMASSAKTQQQVYINPKFLDEAKKVSDMKISNKQSDLTTQPEAELLNAQLLQKQKELYEISKQKSELELWTRQAILEDRERALREKEEELKRQEESLKDDGPSAKKLKKRSRGKSRSPSPRKPNTSQRWNRGGPRNLKSRSRSPQNWSGKRSGPNKMRNVRSPVNRSDMKPLAQKTVLHGLQGDNFTPVTTTIPAPSILASNDVLSASSCLPGLSNAIVAPITSLALPGAEINPSVVKNSSVQSIQNVSSIPSVSTPMTKVAAPKVAEMSVLPWPQDRDYRFEFEAMVCEADERLRSGKLSSQDHDVLMREMERAMGRSNGGIINKGPINCQGPNGLSDDIDGQRLCTVVDGKSRNLFYLDDNTAIVLMKGPLNGPFSELIKMNPTDLVPKEIRFEGKPTKVFIDSDRGSNEFVLLDFNNQSQTFFHNEHSQRIRFGGPCREIILNGKPYLATFGGLPIQVWFNGDNVKPHTLRLDGPPPRVQISEEMRCDLWEKYVEKMTAKPPSPASSSAPMNINDLLSKLVASGLIKNNDEQTAKSVVPQTDSKSPKQEEDTAMQDDGVEFDVESMKIPRAFIIAAIYNGIQCTNCSLRFDDKDMNSNTRSKYSKHLDWHFRQNRKDKARPSSSVASLHQGWYYPLDLWLQYREVSDEDESEIKIDEDESEEEEVPVCSVPTSGNEENNKCAVCGEAFEVRWFEEEEEWRLMKAVVHNDRIYHPLCLEDFCKQQKEEEEVKVVEHQICEPVMRGREESSLCTVM